MPMYFLSIRAYSMLDQLGAGNGGRGFLVRFFAIVVPRWWKLSHFNTLVNRAMQSHSIEAGRGRRFANPPTLCYYETIAQ